MLPPELGGDMKRREFITLIGGAAAWPFGANAEQVGATVIGFLNSASPELFEDRLRAFREGLAKNGVVEGQDVKIEYRWADGKYDRLPALASELVHHQVAVIVATGGTPSVLAAKSATTAIPIVFTGGFDPIQVGLVVSMNRPGGNLTGVVTLAEELGPKLLELLYEVVPSATDLAALLNPNYRGADVLSKDLLVAAHDLGLRLHLLNASSDREVETAFASLAELGVGGLVIGNDPFFFSQSKKLASLAVRYAVPTIYNGREFCAAGGLMSYGGSFTDAYRIAGIYTARILKGERPAELPVQQSTKVDLIINLGAAKILGLTMPPTLLARADEVTE